MYKIPEFQNLVEMAIHRAQVSDQDTYATFLKDNGEKDDHASFRSLDEDARKIATALTQKGLSGRNVMLLFPSGIDYIRAFFGCLYAGIVPVPAYPPTGAKDLDRLQKIAQDCNAAAILSNHALSSVIENWVSQLGYEDIFQTIAIEDFLIQPVENGFEPFFAQPDDVAFLQYTSGSTGHPKGVEITHGNLLANFQQIIRGFLHGNEALQNTDDLNVVIWLPPFHDMGLIGGVLSPLYQGAQLTLMAPLTFLKRPLLWLKTIAEQKAQISGGPNFCYQYCVRKISEEQAEQLDLSQWHVAFNGAEPVQAATLKSFSEHFAVSGFKANAFMPCYGLAEASLFVAGSPSGRGVKTLPADLSALAQGRYQPSNDPQQNAALVSSGTLAMDTEVRIVNPRTGRECNENEVGEIWINSPSVARGYWNKPQYSESIFRAQLKHEKSEKHYLRSGDMGFLNNGELYVSGRIKEVIILSGRNHYPQDIEQTLQQANPAFKAGAGAAFSITEDGKESLVILQEVNRSAGNQADYKLLASTGVQAVSARHGVIPTALVLLTRSAIPKTSSGKIQRADAKRLYLEGNFVPAYIWQPGTKVSSSNTHTTEENEDTIFDWFSELHNELQHWIADKLDIEPHHIDLDVTFSELGVDSIETVEIIDQLQDRIGRVIPATELLRYPTVKALIQHFATEMEEKALQEADLADET